MAWLRGVIRGFSAALVAGLTFLALLMVFDVTGSRSRPAFLVAAAAAGLVVLMSPGLRVAEATGAAVAGLAAIGSGLRSGFGALEWSMAAGAAVAIAWSLTGSRLPAVNWGRARWAWPLIPVLLFVLVPLVIDGGTLGHDEAAYGVKAKQWLYDTPGSGWSPHRGIAMSLYGYLVLDAGGGEAGLRLIGLLGVLTLAVAVWLLANRLAGARVAAVSSLAVVAGPAMLRRSTEYLSDIPSAALLVVCAWIVWCELGERDAPSYRLLWVLAPAWLAFYLRYQSALSLGLIGLIAAILWWPKIRSRPGPVITLIGIGLIGLIPHFIQSVDLRGSPWGILTFTGDIAGRAFIGEGLVDYARDGLWPLAGFVGPLAVAGSVAGLVGYWKLEMVRVRLLFLMVPAVLQVLALGLLSHGEPRFVFFPLALIVIAATIAVERWARERSRSWAPAVAAAMAVLVVGSFAISSVDARRSVANRADRNRTIEESALLVAAEASEDACSVLTTFSPQMTYYSECETDTFRPSVEPSVAVADLPGEHRFMALLENGLRQPEGDRLAAYQALTTGPPTVVEGVLDVEVYRFD